MGIGSRLVTKTTRMTKMSLGEAAGPYDGAAGAVESGSGFEAAIPGGLRATGWSGGICLDLGLQERRGRCEGSSGKQCSRGLKLNQDGRRAWMDTCSSLALIESDHCSSRGRQVSL